MRLWAACAVILCAARATFALTCSGFSIIPADHVIVKYSAPLPAGATLMPPAFSVLGTDVSVSRNVSGGSAVDVACVDDRVDLGSLGAGRFNLTWSDNAGFMSQRSSFTFLVGAPAAGTVNDTSVLLPLLPDQPVRLEVNACSQHPAVAYLSGNDILISQFGSGSACKLYILDFGLLPAGIYNLTTMRLDGTSAAPSSKSFSFIVQQPAATSACNGTFLVTRTERGTARLHYEDQYPGYAPAFGLPAVTEILRYFAWYPTPSWPLTTVVQPVADTADSTKLVPGSGPSICHAEDLDIGTPAEGYNEIQWFDQVIVNGREVGFRTTGAPVGFYWYDGRMQCSAFPELITPSPALEGAPIHLAMSMIGGGFSSYTKSAVSGRTVTIDVVGIPYVGPLPPYPEICGAYEATVAPLPAGEYTLVWRFQYEVITSRLTVVKPTRQRAARH